MPGLDLSIMAAINYKWRVSVYYATRQLQKTVPFPTYDLCVCSVMFFCIARFSADVPLFNIDDWQAD